MQVKSFRDNLTAKLPTFVFALFILQPVMDVISFWFERLGLGNSLTLVLRMGVLAAIMLVGFYISDSKRVYYITAGVLTLFAAGHIFACIQAGYRSPFSDLTNYIRIVQMPITTICLISMLKQNQKCYQAMRYGVLSCLVIILAVEVLAVITNTDPHTYPDGRGTIGWFQNTNSQSCILTMLPPVAVVLMLQRRGMKDWRFWVLLMGSMVALFALGPRLSMSGIAALGFGLAVSIMLIDYTQWKKALALVAAAMAVLAFIGHSPMQDHQVQYESVQEDRQKSINHAVSDAALPALKEEGVSEEEMQARRIAWIKTLIPIYERYVPDFVEIFGVEKTMEIYDYAYDIKEITGTRYKKIQFAKLLMNDSPKSSQLFGLELSRFTVDDNIYDVENDFHGIYFLCGIVGLALMLAFLGYFVWLILWALIKNWKRYFTLEAAAWGIALVMCLIHAYFTAAILRRPNASFYLSAVLAAVYYLVKIKTYSTSDAQKEA